VLLDQGEQARHDLGLAAESMTADAEGLQLALGVADAADGRVVELASESAFSRRYAGRPDISRTSNTSPA